MMFDTIACKMDEASSPPPSLHSTTDVLMLAGRAPMSMRPLIREGWRPMGEGGDDDEDEFEGNEGAERARQRM